MGKKNPKKLGVGVEFKKVKHKVGKKLPKAANETKVDFKSRSINLPSQSITAEKEGGATSRRNLTVKELLSQTHHHNAKTRKEAIQELGDLLTRFPAESQKYTGLIIETLADRVSDADKAVRTAFCELLKEKFLPFLSPAAVSPFLPVLMAHLCSAMTNLSTEIRLDALNFLHALMEAVPELLSRGFLVPCLQHLQDLLSQLHRARSLKAQSLPALHKVVGGMSFFLQRAFIQPAAVAKATEPRPQASSPPALHHQVSSHSLPVSASGRMEWAPLGAARCVRNPETGTSLLNKLKSSVSDAEAGMKENNAADGLKKVMSQAHTYAANDPAVKQVAVQLLCALFDCWSEATPAQLSSAPELESVQVLLHILRCANTLMQHLPLMDSSTDKEKLRKAVWSRVHPFFPAPAPSIKPSQALHDALVQYNLEAALLLIGFTPKEEGPPQVDEVWVQRLVRFYCGVMECGEVLPVQAHSLGAAQTGSGRPTHTTAATVLSAIPALLSRVSPPGQAALLAAVHHLSCAVPVTSPTQSACILLQQELLAGALRTGGTVLAHDQLSSWLDPLPKMLWELNTKQPETSLAALQLLHEAARCASPETGLADALSNIASQLPPLFCIHLTQKNTLPSTGRSPSAAAKQPKPDISHQVVVLLGPLSRLSPRHQTIAVDILPSLPSLAPKLLESLTLALSTTAFHEEVSTRLVALLTHHSLSLPFTAWASMLGSILTSPLTRFQSQDGASLSLPSPRFNRLVDTITMQWRGGHAGLLAALAAVEEQLLHAFRSSWHGMQTRGWQADEAEWSSCQAISYGILKLLGSCPAASLHHAVKPSQLEQESAQVAIAHEVATQVLRVVRKRSEAEAPGNASASPKPGLTAEQAHEALTSLKSDISEVTWRLVSERRDVAVSCVQQVAQLMDRWSTGFKQNAPSVKGSTLDENAGEKMSNDLNKSSNLRVVGWGLAGTACALVRACIKLSNKDKSHAAWGKQVGVALEHAADGIFGLYEELADGGQLYMSGQSDVQHIRFVVKDWVERGSRSST